VGGTHRCREFACLALINTHHFFVKTAPQASAIWLKDIGVVERTDIKQYCLIIETKDRKVWLNFKSDTELHEWQEDIYNRSPLMAVSHPTNFVHKIHVGFDPISGAFTVSAVQMQCDILPLRKLIRVCV
jgi:hypothetical protein